MLAPIPRPSQAKCLKKKAPTSVGRTYVTNCLPRHDPLTERQISFPLGRQLRPRRVKEFKGLPPHLHHASSWHRSRNMYSGSFDLE